VVKPEILKHLKVQATGEGNILYNVGLQSIQCCGEAGPEENLAKCNDI